MAADIRTISAEFGFSPGRTVLYGSSQGGFAALAVGSYLTASTVVAEAPQTDVRRSQMIDDTSRAAHFCYGVPTINDVPQAYDYRLKLHTLFAKRGYIPKGRILVKETDRWHIDEHIVPFKELDIDNRLSVRIFTGEDGKGGHSALRREVIVDIINSQLYEPSR
ncbi:hypothetical protein [Paracoccus sp. SSJ]|uniref:hypothetical protein n=1 Tax=Paracoccus sp. SSJ TaxID=3050636 RepID=UPI00254BAB13|nr:hypothetical protein [Paracoccus sp. SSJ]